jgi:ribosomal protein L37E
MPQKQIHDVVNDLTGPFKGEPFYQHARAAAATGVIRSARDFVLDEVEKNKDIAVPDGMNPVPGKEIVSAMFGPFLSMKMLDRPSLFDVERELRPIDVDMRTILLAGKILNDVHASLQIMSLNVPEIKETTPAPADVLERIGAGAKASIPGFSFPTIASLVAGFAEYKKNREIEQHEVCEKCGDVHYLDHGRAVLCSRCGGAYKLVEPAGVVQ